MIRIESADEMQEFAEKIGKSLAGGEIFELVGDVGAGKTTFVRGLAKGMGITEQVQSPSFTINRVYDMDDDMRMVHYDFYRLQDPGIMADELSEMLSDAKTVVVIEWADSVADILPTDRVTIRIVPEGELSRVITVEAGGDNARKVTKVLQ